MDTPTPTVTPTQQAASEWAGANWRDGLRIAGADSNYVAFHAFCAGAAFASAPARLRAFIDECATDRYDRISPGLKRKADLLLQDLAAGNL